MKYTFLFAIGFCSFVFAQEPVQFSQLQQQAERRQSVIDDWALPTADGRIPIDIVKATLPTAEKQARCFDVTTVKISTPSQQALGAEFTQSLTKVLVTEGIVATKQDNINFHLSEKESGKVGGKVPCLSAARIERITTKLQNYLVGKGLITTRVLIPEQDLSEGVFNLSIAKGKIGQIKVGEGDITVTHANRANVYNAFPTDSGDVLNLRDLEQGLENLRRVPSVSAEMDVKPGESQNSSDVVVKWQQRKYPFRLNVSVDDSGSRSTGKYLATMSLAWDNPLRLNDIFYASYTRNLKSGDKRTDTKGKTDKGKTHNYTLNYSIPLGYWLFDIGMSDYHYDQVVAGIDRNHHYTGDSRQANINLSKVLYRDDKHKLSAKAGFWRKTNKSFINDAEVEVQRRRTGGWKAELSQRSYFSLGTLNSTLSYKRGTRAFGAMPAPEELFNEGTAKMKIWTADVSWQMPFQLGQYSFGFDSRFHGQWNKSLLTSQDRIAIGGRHSVRGFNGSKSLSGDRGWYLRNNLTWNYQPNHSLYLGLDTGHISGVSAKDLPGQSLSGAVLGLKGQFRKAGDWYYDIFVGTPLHQPKGFDADSTVFGFNLSYSL